MNSKSTIEGIYSHDNTGWMDDAVTNSAGGYICLWWHQRPAKTLEVEDQLRSILNSGSTFYWYFLQRNLANYRAKVVDFASKEDYGLKMIEWKKLNPMQFQEDFDKYDDGKRKAGFVCLCREFERLSNGIPVKNFLPYKDLIDHPRQARIIAYTSLQTENDINQKNMINKYIDLLKDSKNLIFTGAPGTGKTYLAKQIAKQLIDPNGDVDLEHCEQYGFVQFHPSYDYTDFVEGLRPSADDNGNIGFELRPGVFKMFCERARKNLEDSKKSGKEISLERQLEDKFNKLIESIQNDELEKISNKKSGNYSYFYDISRNNNIRFKRSGGVVSTNVVSLDRLKKIAEKYRSKADLANLTTSEITQIIGGCNPSTFWAVLNYLYTEYGDLTVDNVKDEKVEKKDYVFVIDEINRGEISKIFGELFFSIDPGYRGEKGAVDTQYANMHEADEGKFYVPENVYIIGTMNDIDRSVESFDFAMRRRFTWKEITAEDSAKNMGLSPETVKKMNDLNKKIAEVDGLGQSYQIGGAYFLDAEGNERKDGADGEHPDYQKVWDLRLQPLLKEYLRGMPNSDTKLEEFKTAFGL